MTSKEFGERVRKLRTDAGMTQKEAKEYLEDHSVEVSQRAFEGYDRGEYMPDDDSKAKQIIALLESARQRGNPQESYLPMGVSDRLREVARELFDGNKSELARKLDMKPPSFSKYTSGDTTPGSRVLKKLADIGVNPTWVLTGKGEMMLTTEALKNSDSIPPRSHVSSGKGPSPDMSHSDDEAAPNNSSKQIGEDLWRIPLLSVEVAAGDGVVAHEKDELEEAGPPDYLPEPYIRQEYGVRPQRVFDVRVRGDSMTDTIRAGERIRCVTWDGEDLVDGSIYILAGPWGALIKRVLFTGDTLTLHSDNDARPDTELSHEEFDEQYRVVASLLHVLRRL